MCGGAPRSTITMPNTGAYDRMASMQLDAMRAAQSGGITAKQAELDRTLTKQQQTAQRLEQRAVARANDTAANAARLTALIGTPPPEKTAKAPVLGSRRSSATASVGRRALRIDTGA